MDVAIAISPIRKQHRLGGRLSPARYDTKSSSIESLAGQSISPFVFFKIRSFSLRGGSGICTPLRSGEGPDSSAGFRADLFRAHSEQGHSDGARAKAEL
jgi:hypothetical protein